MKKMHRAIIYAKDIQLITGKGLRSARYMMQKIKISLNKSPESLITIDEFCVYAGIDKEDIMHLIID
ncbi:hypothetical protein [Cytophaga hutchinsonii]|uniref:Uncharacterized protein n=1 Tax=Cytophaga hutchinsonii (strain ATCC 33406 / DSM 1761 / CIP 103989 / NBRC 15051 / NCIMB 9469 / D465) TaxID=269798 RepID=A0A6N4SQB5_CYTH3|nr:hypothetical protein [Cytophaga hutchinsonii]ABG58466.1 hypothetical protein CHU_1191 [Cytophaga hutchinsonii ATCC 33406]SFX75020.1 hypothetical protein SAMN04487930_10932 [Cytophaga hutchinsonii ATCC 33406]